MKELLAYIAHTLVDKPEAVQIKERAGRYTVTYELHVAPEDTGKVIGRSGRVAKAIRDVMSVSAARRNKRVHVDIKS
ncbi:MAG: KH domain-containing protein [Chloroflexaceae bacterium]|nr:KH domain-containing protein [Chloroflexaceae bacterium]NJO06938.1 KH domain-containing protein [Chloroflexaceae bacterium]